MTDSSVAAEFAPQQFSPSKRSYNSHGWGRFKPGTQAPDRARPQWLTL